MGYLIVDTFFWLLYAPFRSKPKRVKVLRVEELVFQMVRLGFRSVSIVVIVHIFLGLVLALQMAYILRQFGVQEYIASIVSVSMFRELGPLVTAIVMAGFAGASIAAEIGTMEVSEEIMALRTSGINPIRFLVIPRMLAALIMIPCLAMIASVVGIIGGAIIGVGLLGIDLPLYIDKTIEYLDAKDLYTGVIKSVAFALIIVALACFEGFKVRGGAEGVGKATTNTVVYSIIAIIALDVVFTTIFFYVT
jgi:phospholipid/cholesterol/gamma-HCH transport system permease protein